jgi:Polysaccharide biosynthesis C-terminal domain
VFTAAQLNTAVQQAFAILFLPLAARLFTRGNIDGLRDSYWHTAAVVAVLTFPIFALTGPLAPDTTVSLFGARYAASGTVLAVLAVGYYINVSLGFNAYALQVCGRIRFLVVVNVAVIIVNLALCWALAPPLSAVGVAAANAIALIGQNLANQWALRRSLRSGFLPRAYLRCYASVVIAAAALWGLQLLVHPRVIVAVAVAMAASVVVLAVSRAPLRLGATFPELRRIPLVGLTCRCIDTAHRYIGTAHIHRRPGRGLAKPGHRHFAHRRHVTGAQTISLERETGQGADRREERARYDHAPPDPDHALPGRSLSAQVGRRAHQEERSVSIGAGPSPPWPPPDDDDTEPILPIPWRLVPGPAAMTGRRQRRRRPSAPAVVLGAAVITGIGAGGYLLVHQGSNIQAAPGAHGAASRRTGRAAPTATHTTAPAAAAPRVLAPASASAIGFTGRPGDNSAQARLAIDRNPATAWSTNWYTTARFGNLFPGTGLLLDMGRTVTITAVRIRLSQPSGAGLQVRVGSGPAPSSMRIIAHAANAGGLVHLRPARPAQCRYVLIWFTRLPPDPAGTFLVRVYGIRITGQR